MASRKGSYSSDETEILEDDFNPRKQKATPLWDSFQDPPNANTSGSSATWRKFQIFIKIVKIFVYIIVFAVVLCTSVVSKLSLSLVVDHLLPGTTVRYCDIRHPSEEYYAIFPEKQRVALIWLLIFAFTAPELFTFLRATRICFFKNIRVPKVGEVMLVGVMETLHVVGLVLLVFFVLPKMNSVKGLMLMNSLSIMPGVLGLLSGLNLCSCRSIVQFCISGVAICAQCTVFLVWPVTEHEPTLWAIVPAVLLISFRWWENYISAFSIFPPLRRLAKLREKLTESRYYMYLFISPWKVWVFFIIAILIDGRGFSHYFNNFLDGWGVHEIEVKMKAPLYTDGDLARASSDLIIESAPMVLVWILLVNAGSSYLCYIFSKFACKIKIQEFSFSLPLSISTPVAITVFVVLTGFRDGNVCTYHGYFPDYIFFKNAAIYNLFDYIFSHYMWVWPIWWMSQAWITRHIWHPQNDRNASTEKLFIAPWYSSLVVDQCIIMNRRREDREEYVVNMDSVTFKDPEATYDPFTETSDIRPSDKIPQVMVCATMWHETKEEMMEFLKSIIRLDGDQCARRLARKYIQADKSHYDDEYYELETHIFFDDAFVTHPDLCNDFENPPVNSYVKLLIGNIENAATEVYKTKMTVEPPKKIITPYGGRLTWTLPGRTKMVAHLKNKDKIRHKKRWSQVMYMYYLLGYRIMQMDASPQRKILIAQNTYLLALDGDIDFQPQAVQLLIGRMKVDPDLGAACGRIHPVGKGPMVWYQVFEYAIGHWLQKATEHVIGCVLCSPGCFSLFRGRALMENSVMKKYTTTSDQARHYVQYDQGEDRWLCTLILKQKFRVEYSAASDAYTHSPEGFFEFYNQRRRWVPSTIANILDLLGDAKMIVENNNSISMPYICYQAMLMAGTVLGPGTIFLMMVGSLVAVFSIDIWTSFLWNFIPVVSFMGICYFCKQKYQLIAAFVISSLYSLVMMAVLIGIIIQVMDDGILSPASLFFVAVAAQIVVTGLMHPQEAGALLYGIIYYITIPSMYLLLLIYSLFNMNDVSWGTRENPQPASVKSSEPNKKKQTRLQRIFNFLKPTAEEEGGFDFSISGLFRCMFCTHQKPNTEQAQLLHITDHLAELNSKLRTLELKLSGEITVMTPEEKHPLLSESGSKHDEEEQEKHEYLPSWLDEPSLEYCKVDSLSIAETNFWTSLITKYLKPLVLSTKAKDNISKELRGLRDVAVFAFVMINALFVLIVFLLQIKKSYLHIRWPFNAINTIEFDDKTQEITIFQEYLELEPIGLLFVLFFGTILAIQFCAMLVHRFGTISQILASTSLDWYCCSSGAGESAKDELRGAAYNIAKTLQQPKLQFEDDDSDSDEGEPVRRTTIHKLLMDQTKEQDWFNLEVNFKRRFFKEDKIKLGRISVSRKTLALFQDHRMSHIEERKRRKTIKEDIQRRTIIANQQLMAESSPTFAFDNAGFTPSRFDLDDIELIEKSQRTPLQARVSEESV